MASKAKKQFSRPSVRDAIIDALAEAFADGKTLREAFNAAVLAGKAASK